MNSAMIQWSIDSMNQLQGAAVAFKVKEKKPGQRACDEKDAKGELCLGHLKRWYYDDPHRLTTTPEEEEALKEFGRGAEVYRCERCHTLYRPVSTDHSTAGQKFQPRPVNLLGAFGKSKVNRQESRVKN
jgi:hypothetical protein